MTNILKRVYYDSPERGWKTKKDYVVSIIFEFSVPIALPHTTSVLEEHYEQYNRMPQDERVISKEWVMLVETELLDQVQISSIEKGGPTGWTLGELVYDSEPAHDKEAIKWMANNYELLTDAHDERF